MILQVMVLTASTTAPSCMALDQGTRNQRMVPGRIIWSPLQNIHLVTPGTTSPRMTWSTSSTGSWPQLLRVPVTMLEKMSPSTLLDPRLISSEEFTNRTTFLTSWPMLLVLGRGLICVMVKMYKNTRIDIQFNNKHAFYNKVLHNIYGNRTKKHWNELLYR